MASQFVHLHLHTQFSLLDGASQIEPLIGCEAYMTPGSRFAAKDSGLAHNDHYHPPAKDGVVA